MHSSGTECGGSSLCCNNTPSDQPTLCPFHCQVFKAKQHASSKVVTFLQFSAVFVSLHPNHAKSFTATFEIYNTKRFSGFGISGHFQTMMLTIVMNMTMNDCEENDWMLRRAVFTLFTFINIFQMWLYCATQILPPGPLGPYHQIETPNTTSLPFLLLVVTLL